jgi:hypothetical protein
MNITLAEYRKHAYSSRPRAGESAQDDLFANCASWLAGQGARENYESNNPGCWIAIPVAQLDRARCHHDSRNIEKLSSPIDQEKGRRALRRRPFLATAGSWVRFRCFALRLPELF